MTEGDWKVRVQQVQTLFLSLFQPWSEFVIFLPRFGSPVFNVMLDEQWHKRPGPAETLPKTNQHQNLKQGTRKHKNQKSPSKEKSTGRNIKIFDPRRGTRLRANFCPMPNVLQFEDSFDFFCSRSLRTALRHPSWQSLKRHNLCFGEENKRAKLKQNFQTFRTIAGSNI